MKPIIEVQNLSKKYTIGATQPRYLSLRDSLTSTFKGVKNWTNFDKSTPPINEFWALQNIDFQVNAGESIGIIGRNGAGKSTLLKILSRITPPTSGHAILRGRLASLLEVGTGFHPELTGRENVYFNGSILGLRKAEIDKKFDEIVDFSGIERFIDTPLKNYSSGMQLRLAFAVAAHLEPEILIIDEVLAVGDAEFQKKCLGKMDEVSKSGRTVLFVSHNIGIVQQLCSTGIWLNKGTIVEMGTIQSVTQNYLKSTSEDTAIFTTIASEKDIFLQFIKPVNADGQTQNTFFLNESPIFDVSIHINTPVKGAVIGFILLDRLKRRVFTTEQPIEYALNNPITSLNYRMTVPALFLLPDQYSWHFAIHVPNQRVIDGADDICPFTVVDTGNNFTKYGSVDNGVIFSPVKWARTT